MSVYIYGDSNSSIAALVGNDEEEDRDGINNKDVYGQKKRKRWKTLLDGLILRRRRKSTISRQALKEGQDSTHREDTHHVFMVMDSLYQAEHRMLKYGRNTVRDTQASANAAHVDDGDGSGVECLHFADQQPTKKMKLGRAYSSDVPFAISEDDAESTTSGVKSLGSCSTPGMANGTLRVMPSDLESVLSLWSVLHRVDMVALFQDIGEEEIELILVDEDIRDMVVEKPWAFTPEERSKILEACADLNDPSDDASDTCSVLSWSGVSSLSSNSACHIPIALAFTCRSRGAAARAVNPWAAAKRGDMKALQAIAATHNPSIWMTGKSTLKFTIQGKVHM
jgi:hypothetical protein